MWKHVVLLSYVFEILKDLSLWAKGLGPVYMVACYISAKSATHGHLLGFISKLYWYIWLVTSHRQLGYVLFSQVPPTSLFISYTCAVMPSCFWICIKAQMPLMLIRFSSILQHHSNPSTHLAYPDPMMAIDGVFCVSLSILFCNRNEEIMCLCRTTRFYVQIRKAYSGAEV